MSNLLLEHATDALLLETGDYLLLEGLVSGWGIGAGWSIGSGIATCDGTQTTFTLMSQILTAEIGIDYAIEFELNTRIAGSVSVEFEGVEVIAAQTVVGTYSVIVAPLTAAPELVFKGSFDFDGSIDNVTVKRSWWLETNWVRGSLAIQGQSERQSPSSVNVKYKEPDDLTPNWQTKSAIRTFPDAASGLTPFIQTTISLPGTQNLNEAYNKAVIKMQRMFDRIAVSYQTTDSGMYQRIGDVVQLLNSTRGADLRVWVESVKLIEPGRFQIDGIFYSELHFSNSAFGSLHQCDAVYEFMLHADPIGYWPLFDGPAPLPSTNGVIDKSSHNNHYDIFDVNNGSFFNVGGEDNFPPALDECGNRTGMVTSNGFGGSDAFRKDNATWINYQNSGSLMWIMKDRTNADGRYALYRWQVLAGPSNQQKPSFNIINHDSGLWVGINTPTSQFGVDNDDGGLDDDRKGQHTWEGALSASQPQVVIFLWDYNYVPPGSPPATVGDVKLGLWINGVDQGDKHFAGFGENIQTTGDFISGPTDIDGRWNHHAHWNHWISEELIAEIQRAADRNQSGYTP